MLSYTLGNHQQRETETLLPPELQKARVKVLVPALSDCNLTCQEYFEDMKALGVLEPDVVILGLGFVLRP